MILDIMVPVTNATRAGIPRIILGLKSIFSI